MRVACLCWLHAVAGVLLLKPLADQCAVWGGLPAL